MSAAQSQELISHLSAISSVGEEFSDNFCQGEEIDAKTVPILTIPKSGNGGMWVIDHIDGKKSTEVLSVIVVTQKPSRILYTESYADSGKDKSRPYCLSQDGVRGAIHTHKENKPWWLLDKGEPTFNCKTCQYSKFESKASTKEGEYTAGKACAERMNIFVLTQYSRIPFMLSLPPSALHEYAQFRMNLFGAGQKITRIVTNISLTEQSNKSGHTFTVPVFSKGGDLTDEQFNDVKNTVKPFLSVMSSTVNGTAHGTEEKDAVVVNSTQDQI